MKRHLKRLAAPATWNVERRATTFIARPMPSGHAMHLCIPLNVFMKEIAGYAKTTKEVKTILQNKHILVNGRRRLDQRSAAGFLDIIEVGSPEETVRIVLDRRGKISYLKVPAKEATLKVCKVIGKTMLPGKKLQVNFNDGENFRIDAKDPYKVGDSVVVDIKQNKIVEHLPFHKNATVFLIGGKQIGHLAKVLEMDGKNVVIKLEDGTESRTNKASVFVVGKEHPAITVQENKH